MTAWQWLLAKGSGATAWAILVSGITAANAWDGLVEKSTAPNGSTAWVHLISALDQVPAPVTGGGVAGPLSALEEQIAREDEELIVILRAILDEIT